MIHRRSKKPSLSEPGRSWPVHLMGKPAAMDEIMAIAEKNDLYVIEDAAEAHGMLYKGKPAGTIGDMGAFSLYVAHIISTVEGGIIATNRSDFAEVLISLRAHGRACSCVTCIALLPLRITVPSVLTRIQERIHVLHFPEWATPAR